MNTIDKVGGIILKDKKLLVVQKRTKNNRQEFIIPGGKREPGENDFATLARELKEEISVNLIKADAMGSFDDIAIFEQIPIHIAVYEAQITGSPHCDSEIKKLVWIDRHYHQQGIKLGSILDKFVIPMLIEQGKM